MIKPLPLVIAAAVSALIAGCNEPNNAPPKEAMTPHVDSAPTKVPVTKEEKIAAIKNAPMPAKQKEAEIAKVMAGP